VRGRPRVTVVAGLRAARVVPAAAVLVFLGDFVVDLARLSVMLTS